LLNKSLKHNTIFLLFLIIPHIINTGAILLENGISATDNNIYISYIFICYRYPYMLQRSFS